ncbi:3-phosphoserine/phosphohydroxythreonine transaminase [Cognatazoarcus halotolerans]|uniref:3-phosphoserine/phosphohydroxythreonine transaminase n=1 Tax=Cognatazoarcus halotolerans TaxID=2686016 RepID=UPI0013573E53|nr:3-phosphoserine/phosphohydroxythreonine transaminase [Cognatazoarcus halotolerans]MCB1897956.1 3-phosphoserine/phosphohydroxythreonine transaminase [Rhodocyclaceae bacterium]MCP5309639.1 3-phosphoserine/phosphohydroxythreonine transaminase [Zoogloeaceae bacterium]
MSRVFNFSAGPAVLPEAVLKQAAEEMLDWHGSGMGVMEMSHRGKEFTSIYEEAEADLRKLLGVPPNFRILFMQGGAIAENAIIPLNLLGERRSADYVLTGSWAVKSHKEAGRFCTAGVAATAEGSGFTTVPPMSSWRVSEDPAYLFVCTNETIGGVEYPFDPDMAALGRPEVPVVADVSSHILSRPVDFSKYGLLFGGAQKNIGPAGLTIVIVRDDLIGHAHPDCPSAFDYRLVAENGSMYNTPPTYSIYVAGLVFKWLKALGGVAEIERRNIAKAALLYDFLDDCDFYENRVDPACRSRMNVPFFLADESRNEAFLAGAREAGLVQLKGHKSVGGMRASIYNAMPIEGVEALVNYMRDFAQHKS